MARLGLLSPVHMLSHSALNVDPSDENEGSTTKTILAEEVWIVVRVWTIVGPPPGGNGKGKMYEQVWEATSDPETGRLVWIGG